MTRRRRPVLLSIMIALVAGCTTSVSPAPGTPGVTGSPEATVSVPAATAMSQPTVASPSAAPGTFVAANVQVVPVEYASVIGSTLAVAAPDDGSGRLFVATQEGEVWSIGPGPAHDLTEMLDISSE